MYQIAVETIRKNQQEYLGNPQICHHNISESQQSLKHAVQVQQDMI